MRLYSPLDHNHFDLVEVCLRGIVAPRNGTRTERERERRGISFFFSSGTRLLENQRREKKRKEENTRFGLNYWDKIGVFIDRLRIGWIEARVPRAVVTLPPEK